MIFFPSHFKWSSVSQQLHILGGESLNSSPDVGLWLRGPTCNCGGGGLPVKYSPEEGGCPVLASHGAAECCRSGQHGVSSLLVRSPLIHCPQLTEQSRSEPQLQYCNTQHWDTLGHIGQTHAKLDRKNTKQRSRAYDWGHKPAEPAVRLFVSKYSRSFEKSV